MAQENFQLFKIVSISVVYTNISSFEQGYVYLTRYLFSTLKRYPPPLYAGMVVLFSSFLKCLYFIPSGTEAPTKNTYP